MSATSFHEKGISYSPIKKAEYEKQAIRQDAAVLAFFRAHPGREFTPFEVQRIALPNAPITSVRRSITNLTPEFLTKSITKMKGGNYGRMNCTWSLRMKSEQGKLF